MKIAVTGTTGLVGSRFKELLKEKFEIFEVNSSSGIDIRDKNLVFNSLQNFNPSLILHFAGKTNVDACEEDKENDLKKLKDLNISNGESVDFSKINFEDFKNDNGAFAINVVGTKNLADYAKENNSKMIYISSDFVFQGNKEYYSEEDVADPVDWYGMTKYFGEEMMLESLQDYIIARPAYPYGFKNDIKKDLLWKIVDFFEKGDEVSLIYDQIITPTFIDDMVLGLEFLINKNVSGIYHLVGDSFVSPYEIGVLVSEILGYKNKIKKVSLEDVYKDKARRPFKVRLENDKLEQLGFKTKSFEEGARIVLQNN